MIHKILGLFVNTLTVDDKHYLLNRDNLTQPIHMELFKKEKLFQNFFYIFKFLIKFQTFHKKMTLIADLFPEIPASENIVR